MGRPRKAVPQEGSEIVEQEAPVVPDEAPKQRLLKSLINGRIFAWCPELAKRKDMVEV